MTRPQLIQQMPAGNKCISRNFLNEWGLASSEAGDYRGAESPLQRTVAIDEQVLGGESPHVAATLNNLALLYYAQGRYTEAPRI